MIHAASGPTIMAPMNIGMSEPTITPMVAIAPITPPRCPATAEPPVYAIRSGSSTVDIGVTNCASFSFGHHPVSIKSAVMSPHAMNAPMFGMTIPLKNLPNT